MNKELDIFLSGRAETGLLLVGKSSMTTMLEDAKDVASRLLNCNREALDGHPDFLFINKGDAKSIGVEAAEKILERNETQPSIGEKIVVIVDEIHLMTEAAQNKLLKLIEESKHIVVIGVCSNITNMLKTIKSRMRIINYHASSRSEFMVEAVNDGVDEETAQVLYYLTEGCYSLASSVETLVPIFLSLKEDFFNNSPIAMLQTLNLVKEKDSENFFLLYEERVPALYSFLSELCLECLSDDSSDKPKYSSNGLLRAIEIVTSSGCKTKENLFYDMTKFSYALTKE